MGKGAGPSGAGQLTGLSRHCSYNTCSFCVCAQWQWTTHQRFKRRILQHWRDRNSDYGKKDVSLNFTLFTSTLSVTKAIVHFCTCAKRCVLWLPTKSFFTDTGDIEGEVCEGVHVHTHKNKKHRIFILQLLVLLFLVVVTQPCTNGCAQLTALAPTSSLHFRWLVEELLPCAVWDTTGPAPAVPAELQPHLLQLPLQPFSWRDRKERQTNYFIQNFKKVNRQKLINYSHCINETYIMMVSSCTPHLTLHNNQFVPYQSLFLELTLM